MFNNYLKIAFRNLTRYKIFSLINILGLAVGITCCITLTLFIIDELSYDRFNKNADEIYRVYVHSNINGKESKNSKNAAPVGAVLKRDFPEVLSYTRIGYFGVHTLRYEDKLFREGRIYTADSTYFDIFTLPFLYGDPKSALNNPNSVVITETTSRRYFGDENPIGKSFIVDGNGTYLITGVMKDFPENSHFGCNILLSMSTYPINQSQYWFDLWYTTYILLKKGTDPHEFENKIKKTILDNVGPQAETILGVPQKDFFAKGNSYNYRLQPLTSIYLRSNRDYGIELNTEWGDTKKGDITYTYIFSAIVLFILMIAVFNFMNLATARSERRAKEVGIRKTLGSSKSKLVGQFITESTFTCFLSILVSIVFLQGVLPIFSKFVGKELKLEFFNNLYTIPSLILFTIVVGVLAGSYPAFYLSSFQPAHILKPSSGKGKTKGPLRSILVIIQFAISITLIIGTVIIKDQLNYIQNKNLGFNKELLISLYNGAALGNQIETFKRELSKYPNIISATSSSLMFAAGIPGNGYLYNKSAGSDVVLAQFLDVDFDFVKTFQVEMKQGRFFSEEYSMDSSAVVINETAAKELKASDPVGKDLYKIGGGNDSKNYKIIGIMKDFNYESLHHQIRPLVFHLSPVRQATTVITIRISSGDVRNTIGMIERTWQSFTNGERFNYGFLDQNLANLYNTEEKISAITTVFSVLAIFIACLGLFGLAAFVTEQRTKEIGIRKVIGASVVELIVLLSKEFTQWILLANLIAWPVAYYVLNNWLQDFAYRIDLSLWVFILSGGVALVIALATVSFQAIKAATRNPVESLRYE